MTGETRKPIIDAEEFFRQQEARLAWEERRPQVTRAADLLGPGLGPRAIEITDFDSELASFNGFYYAAPGALNSPNDTKWWMGYTISPRTEGVGGIQVFWTFRAVDSPHSEVMRGFETSITASGAHTYGPWEGNTGTQEWQTVTSFLNGFQTYAEDVEYMKDSAGVVHFVGRVNRTSGSGAHMFTVPPDYRPAKDFRLTVASEQFGNFAFVTIETNGVVNVVNLADPNWVSLSAFSYTTL